MVSIVVIGFDLWAPGNHEPRGKVQITAERDDGYRQQFEVNRFESAALLDIDTCPMEGLVPAEYNKILKLDGVHWSAVAAVACGYRSAEDPFQHNAKVRFDHKDIFKYV